MWSKAWARLALCAILAVSAAAIITSTASATPTCNDTWGGSTNGDWDTAGNWTAGVPTSSSAVCIESGSAVITAGNNVSLNLASLDVGSLGTAQLTVSIHDVVQSGSTTIGAQGTLVLNGSYAGNAGNASLGGGPVDNKGTIVMEGTGYFATLYGAILNQGTISVPYGTASFCQGGNGGTGSLDNQGTINVAAPSTAYPGAPATVQVNGCSITDDTGGSIVNNGTFDVFGDNGTTATYTQGNGTETGNPITTGQASSIAYTGTGASSIDVPASTPEAMSGNLAAGQDLEVDIGSVVTEANSFTSAGQIVLNGNYQGGGGPPEIAVSSGTFTNTGTITAESNDADPSFAGNVVNDGVVTVTPNTEIELLSGSFTNAASGTFEPQISSSALSDMRIDGDTTFIAGGTLAPQLEGGFTPTVGQEFNVINLRGGSESGTFASVAGDWFADYSNPDHIAVAYGAAPGTPASVAPAPSSPAPTSPTPTSTAGRTAVAPGVTALAGGAGVIDVKLKCAASACQTFSVRATVTEHLKGRKLVSLTALKTQPKARTKVVAVASAKGTLKTGKALSLKLKLNAAGQALLKRYGKLKVSVVISAGGKVIKHETVTVTKAKVVTKRK